MNVHMVKPALNSSPIPRCFGSLRPVCGPSPIVAPSQVPWGQKTFTAYLGLDRQDWRAWDTVELVTAERQERLPLLVDQGDADEFLATQLQSKLLQASCKAAGHPLTLRMQPGYDHSYYFIATFLGDHFDHHASYL